MGKQTSVKINPNNNLFKENIFGKKYVCINFLCQTCVYSTDVFLNYAEKHSYGKETNTTEILIINHYCHITC